MLNVIVSHKCKEVVAKLVTKKKFVQIRGKQQTGDAKLSFKLTLSAHLVGIATDTIMLLAHNKQLLLVYA